MPHLPRRSLPAAHISDESHRVTTFELFFDLMFVFAFTQVTGFMVHEPSFPGVLQGMAILVLLWLYVLSSAAFRRRMGGGWKMWRVGTAVLLLAVESLRYAEGRRRIRGMDAAGAGEP